MSKAPRYLAIFFLFNLCSWLYVSLAYENVQDAATDFCSAQRSLSYGFFTCTSAVAPCTIAAASVDFTSFCAQVPFTCEGPVKPLDPLLSHVNTLVSGKCDTKLLPNVESLTSPYFGTGICKIIECPSKAPLTIIIECSANLACS